MAKQQSSALKVGSKRDAQSKMLSGSAWMTAGSIFSRILGAIYIIPWVTWLGSNSDQANALFAKGYNIYSLFLMAATAGVPSAISKLVAHYNALNEYGVGRRLYRHGIYVSALTGLVCALVLYFGAGILANGDPNVVPVLRSLTLAVLIIPTMSLTRGFFQGYQNMAPSAISQFVEQLFRVVYMLGATYLIMKLMHGRWQDAVTQSTFAAFIGAIGSFLILGFYYMKNRTEMNALVAQSNDEISISSWSLISNIIKQAIPFIIIGAATSILQIIDQYTFFPAMKQVVHLTDYQLNSLYALFSFNANKLIMIIISLASALAITVIPLLSGARARDDVRSIREQIANVLMLFYFVMMPASLGLAAVAQPIYTIFYRYSAAGTTILIFNAFIGILLGLLTVVSAVMQGISENTKTLKYLGVGLVIKMVIQFPAIWLFQTMGPLLATGISMAITDYLIIHSLNVEFQLPFKKMSKPTNQILVYSLITFVVAKAVVSGAYLVLAPGGRFAAFIVIIPAVALGAGIYVYLMLRSHLADKLLGARVAGLRRRLHIKG